MEQNHYKQLTIILFLVFSIFFLATFLSTNIHASPASLLNPLSKLAGSSIPNPPSTKEIVIRLDNNKEFYFITGIFGKNKHTIGSVNLPNFLNSLFKLLFTITGIALVLGLTLEGTGMIISQIGGNVGKIFNHKQKIINILLGMAILMFSWLILKTVNPKLLDPGFETSIKNITNV